MAYGVYFIPSTAVPQQIGLGTTAMLTLIAYMLTLGNTLPKISYLTRADRFFVGSALLVFIGLLKAVVTLALAQGPKAHYIPRADRWGRVLYPLALLANAALAFLAPSTSVNITPSLMIGVASVMTHTSPGGASRLAALLLPHICPISSVVAPCAGRRAPGLVQVITLR